MSATKVAKKLPKRTGNTKAKDRRAASWNKNAKAKEARKAEQERREKVNAKRGYTGKEYDNALRRAFGKKYREAKAAGETMERCKAIIASQEVMRESLSK